MKNAKIKSATMRCVIPAIGGAQVTATPRCGIEWAQGIEGLVVTIAGQEEKVFIPIHNVWSVMFDEVPTAPSAQTVATSRKTAVAG